MEKVQPRKRKLRKYVVKDKTLVRRFAQTQEKRQRTELAVIIKGGGHRAKFGYQRNPDGVFEIHIPDAAKLLAAGVLYLKGSHLPARLTMEDLAPVIGIFPRRLQHSLNNRFYLGEMTHRGVVIPNHHPVLFPVEILSKIQAIMQRRVPHGHAAPYQHFKAPLLATFPAVVQQAEAWLTRPNFLDVPTVEEFVTHFELTEVIKND
jgi:hypothetical protein